MMSGLHANTELRRRAEELTNAVVGDEPSFEDVRRRAEREYLALLHAVRQAHQQFAFDRDGRPGAVHAIREALPAMERDVFEAVLEDHACELAAIEEALYQFARALARSRK